MSNKKYWLDISIQTRDASATRYGSYRTTAPTASVMHKHVTIRHRKTVDILKFLFEFVEKMVEVLEMKTGVK